MTDIALNGYRRPLSMNYGALKKRAQRAGVPMSVQLERDQKVEYSHDYPTIVLARFGRSLSMTDPAVRKRAARAGIPVGVYREMGAASISKITIARSHVPSRDIRTATSLEYRAAHSKVGSVYFIRNSETGAIKLGHSHDLKRRLEALQVGNSAKLEIVGLIAARKAIEGAIHNEFRDRQIGGEWFRDEGVISKWLNDVTLGLPIGNSIWWPIETCWAAPAESKKG